MRSMLADIDTDLWKALATAAATSTAPLRDDQHQRLATEAPDVARRWSARSDIPPAVAADAVNHTRDRITRARLIACHALDRDLAVHHAARAGTLGAVARALRPDTVDRDGACTLALCGTRNWHHVLSTFDLQNRRGYRFDTRPATLSMVMARDPRWTTLLLIAQHTTDPELRLRVRSLLHADTSDPELCLACMFESDSIPWTGLAHTVDACLPAMASWRPGPSDRAHPWWLEDGLFVRPISIAECIPLYGTDTGSVLCMLARGMHGPFIRVMHALWRLTKDPAVATLIDTAQAAHDLEIDAGAPF